MLLQRKSNGTMMTQKRKRDVRGGLLTVLCAAAIFNLNACHTGETDIQKPDQSSAFNSNLSEETVQKTQAFPEPNPIFYDVEDGHMQLIPDLSFKGGISILSQKDHANGDAVSVLGTHDFYSGGEAPHARWMLAQWDSGPCLYQMMQSLSGQTDIGTNRITDGVGRTFAFDEKDNTMTFELDTALYYEDRPAALGDFWPHLLIEQGDFDYANRTEEQKAYFRCDSSRMVVSLDLRLTDYSAVPKDGDWVEAAQFLLYFYVKGIETDDFCWFGLQLFDNRWERNDNYVGYDGGKADASGAMIYSIGSRYLYTKKDATLWKNGAPNPHSDWVHVEIDLKPYLEEMLSLGLADGYFKADSLSGLCINGMNMGWETIATFDHTMQVRNLSLTSYRE